MSTKTRFEKEAKGNSEMVSWIRWHFLKQRYHMFMLEVEWTAVVLHLKMCKRTLQICKLYYIKREFSFPDSVFRHTWMNSTSHSDNRHHNCVMTVFSALLISFCFLNAHIGYWINVCLGKSKLLHREIEIEAHLWWRFAWERVKSVQRELSSHLKDTHVRAPCKRT